MTRRTRRPSPAMVVACLALLVALGGTSVAAVSQLVPRNSVGTAQLKKNAVVSTKVKNRSLLAADFKAGQLPAGAAGPEGDKGGKGDKGDKGDTGAPGVSEYEIVTAQSPTDSTANKAITASCPAGKKLLGGGALTIPANATTSWVVASFPPNATSWQARGTETPGYVGTWTLSAVAICAKIP